MNKFPCWLTGKNKAIAHRLIENGFVYCGKEEDFIVDYKIAKIHGWQLYNTQGEIALDASCEGALFSKSLELSSTEFDDELRATKQIIRAAHRAYFESSDFIQLELSKLCI